MKLIKRIRRHQWWWRQSPKIERLHQALARKNRQIETLKERIEHRTDSLNHKNDRLTRTNEQLVKLKAVLGAKTDYISRKHQQVVTLRDALDIRATRIAKLKEALGRTRRYALYYRENTPANRFLRLARQAYDAAEILAAETYVGHGVQALPAADMVARTAGGRLICDAIEIPTFGARASRGSTWHPTNLAFLDLAFESYLRRCDGIMTIGWALKGEIEHFGPPVHVIPNYRPAESLVRSNRLREWCGLEPGTRLVLAISSLASDFENVVEALARLPEDVHLAVLGRLVPESYREEIVALIAARRLDHRIHFFPQVPYPELTSTASGADVGLIIRDPAILNNRISLPNRIFDYMFSGLPVCCPEIPDIARMVRDHDMGVVVPELSADGWAGAISAALERQEEMSRNALAASKVMIWERVEDDLYEALGRPGSVTYFGYNDLTKNNRTMRMAASLAKRGVKVTVCTYSDQPPPQIADNVHFHLLDANATS